MIAAGLALALLVPQGHGPEVILAIDRDRVAPGDVIVFTVRVSSDMPDPIRVELPPLTGFEIESRSERNDVSAGATPGRVTWIELRLRAVTPGEWRLGPVNVRQGIAYARGDPIDVTIAGGAPAPVITSLSPRLTRIVQQARPPDVLGEAGITVALSDQNVVVGEQVDVVTIAWFERETRQRLRRAATVEAPPIDGAWSYPQTVPLGIAASRQIGGRWYDLQVVHQVAFPLTPGRYTVAPAKLTYSVPLAYQFFSQEERFELASEPTSFWARELPAAGRPPDFAGAVGHALTITRTIAPAAGRQGEAFSAEVTVRGEGNIALWPEPATRWPAGVRVYPEASEERSLPVAGRFGGAKTFRYLLLPDSAGTLVAPPVEYPYLDPTDGVYHRVTGNAVALVVAPRGDRMASRAEPPPMRLDRRIPIAVRIRTALPPAAWWGLLCLPILLWLTPRLPRPRRPTPRTGAPLDSLAEAERRLRQAVREWGERGEEGAELRDLLQRVTAARFAAGGHEPRQALIDEADAALRRLTRPVAGRPRPRWRERVGLLAFLAQVHGAQAAGQSGPEQLYEAGAYRAAAGSFLRRAEQDPRVTAHWFNLGDAAYRGGSDALALAAYVRAARLSPRDGGVRRALLLVPPADARAAAALWVAPVTTQELWLLGLLAWLGGWAGVRWAGGWRGRWVVLLGGGVVLIGLAEGLAFRYRNPVGIVAEHQPLRLSPHELAPAVGEAPSLSTVVLGVERGAWVQVTAAGGQRGWLERSGVVAVGQPRAP